MIKKIILSLLFSFLLLISKSIVAFDIDGTTTISDIQAAIDSGEAELTFTEDATFIGNLEFKNDIKIHVKPGKKIVFTDTTEHTHTAWKIPGNKTIDILNEGTITFNNYDKAIYARESTLNITNGTININNNIGYGIHTGSATINGLTLNMESNRDKKPEEVGIYLGIKELDIVSITDSKFHLVNNSTAYTSSVFQSQAGELNFTDTEMYMSSRAHYNFNVYSSNTSDGHEQKVIFKNSILLVNTPDDADPNRWGFLPQSAVGINSANTNYQFKEHSKLTQQINGFTGKTSGIELDGADVKIEDSVLDLETVDFDNNTASSNGTLVNNTLQIHGKSQVTIGKFHSEGGKSKLPTIQITGGSVSLPDTFSTQMPNTMILNDDNEPLELFKISKDNLNCGAGTKYHPLFIDNNDPVKKYEYGLDCNKLHNNNDIAYIYAQKVHVAFYSNKSDAQTASSVIENWDIPRGTNIDILGESIPSLSDPQYVGVFKYLSSSSEYTLDDTINIDIKLYASYIPILNLAPDKDIPQGQDYDLKNFIIEATDKEDGVLTSQVNITDNGGFNKDIPGTYIVTFEVVDSDNNIVTKQRSITVVGNSTSGGGVIETIDIETIETPSKEDSSDDTSTQNGDTSDTGNNSSDNTSPQDGTTPSENTQAEDLSTSSESPLKPISEGAKEKLKNKLYITTTEVEELIKLRNDKNKLQHKIQEYIRRKRQKELELKIKQDQLDTQQNGQGEFIKYPSILPQTGPISSESVFEKVGLAQHSPNLDVTIPSLETFRFAGSGETSLHYWLQALPEGEREKSEYIVLPTQGLVMPLGELEKEHKKYQSFIHGNNVNFNEFFNEGAFELPGTSTRSYGEIGNKVIGGHSSYWYNSRAKYRTHFQKIIGLEQGEEIWIYKKTQTGEFTRYIYKVFASYETDAHDISVLKPTNIKQLTLFTCTPIGGITGRWIVKAEFVSN